MSGVCTLTNTYTDLLLIQLVNFIDGSDAGLSNDQATVNIQLLILISLFYLKWSHLHRF